MCRTVDHEIATCPVRVEHEYVDAAIAFAEIADPVRDIDHVGYAWSPPHEIDAWSLPTLLLGPAHDETLRKLRENEAARDAARAAARAREAPRVAAYQRFVAARAAYKGATS